MFKEAPINITQFLPSRKKWVMFLNEQSQIARGSVSKKEQLDQRYKQVTYGYKTPEGVNNLISYNDKSLFPGLFENYKPSKLTQKYINEQGKYDIETTIEDGCLSSNLNITPSTGDLTNIHVSSRSDFLKGEWNDRQLISLQLKEAFLDQLKDKEILPEDYGPMIWIQGTKNKIEPIIKGRENTTLPLSDEALRIICEKTGFDFYFNFIDTEVTIGDNSFDLYHTNPRALDPYRIWQIIRGVYSDGQIFPVVVRKQIKYGNGVESG